MHFHRRGLLAHIGGHNHVEGAGFEQIKEAVGRAGFQQELARLQIVGHIREKPGRHIRVEILDHAEAEARQVTEVLLAQLGPGLIGLVQNRVGAAQEHVARRGQGHGTRLSVQQRGSDIGFEVGELLAYRCCRCVQSLGGGGDGGLFRRCHKHLHAPERYAAR